MNLQLNGFDVFGIDIAISLIKKCRDTSLELKGVVGDAEKLPFKDKSFSLTYCFQSSWYLPNIEDAIKEMFRVTMEGGIICFDVMNKWSPNIIYRVYYSSFKNRLLNIFQRMLRKESRFPENYRTASSPRKINKILKKMNPSEVMITTPPKIENDTVNFSISKLDFLSPRYIYRCKK